MCMYAEICMGENHPAIGRKRIIENISSKLEAYSHVVDLMNELKMDGNAGEIAFLSFVAANYKSEAESKLEMFGMNFDDILKYFNTR